MQPQAQPQSQGITHIFSHEDINMLVSSGFIKSEAAALAEAQVLEPLLGIARCAVRRKSGTLGSSSLDGLCWPCVQYP